MYKHILLPNSFVKIYKNIYNFSTIVISYKQTLRKTCQNTVFFSILLYRIRTESQILSLYEKIRVRKRRVLAQCKSLGRNKYLLLLQNSSSEKAISFALRKEKQHLLLEVKVTCIIDLFKDLFKYSDWILLLLAFTCFWRYPTSSYMSFFGRKPACHQQKISTVKLESLLLID